MNKLVYVCITAATLASVSLGLINKNGLAQDIVTPTPSPVANSPATDLRLLPSPLYQPDSTTQDASILVIPDSPTADEMRAALIVSASFGRMSRGRMPLSMATASQFGTSVWTNYNLIFVGKPAAFPILSQVSLPAPISDTAFVAPELQPDDGLLQMAISPWDNTQVVFVVGGNTDAGLLKAAQALSVGNIQTGSSPALAIIADVHAGSITLTGADTSAVSVPTGRTFGDLGYATKTVSGSGTNTIEFLFDIPPGYAIEEGAYVDLMFNTSTLLDYARSGMVVYINNKVTGSARFSDETAQITVLRINIPASFLFIGNNSLSLDVNLALPDCCAGESFGLWAVIYSASLLHIPLAPATTSTGLLDLSIYPYPFTSDPGLSNTAFVLPQQDPTAWAVAVQLAYNLGRSVVGAPFYLTAVYDEQIPDEVRQNYDWIVIGLPSELPVMGELRDMLPAPFEEGSNVADLTKQQIVYRLPVDTELGYLELLAAPWNHARTILAVVGNSAGGLSRAGDALTIPILRNKLTGDFAIVNGETITSMDTRTRSEAESVSPSATAEVIPAAATPIQSVSQPVNVGRDWIPVAALGLIILMAMILTVVLITGIKNKQSIK